MAFEILLQGTKAVARLEGNLTAANTPELREALKTRIAAGVIEVELDLQAVGMIDSTGIGLLVAIHNSLARLSGRLTVVNASPELLELFKAFRLDRHFSINGVKAG